MRPLLALLALCACGACAELDPPAAADGGSDAAADLAAGDAPSSAPLQTAEQCNGLDDDHDGTADEVPCPSSYACATPGACACAPRYTRCGDRCASELAPYGECRGSCVVYDTPEDCGGCARACRPGLRCVGGRCECPSDAVDCGSGCISLDANNDHCGGCGRRCGESMQCVGGACVCADPGLHLLCGGRCVDAQTDPSHCGACHRLCGGGQRCVDGACVCPAGRPLCDLRCVDPQHDPRHCGGCGRACPSDAACVAGACVCPGPRAAACDGTCVDLRRDLRHCGACDVACTDRQACVDGACRALRIAPGVDERVGNPRPRFWWPPGAGTVDVCEDRACTRITTTFAGDGGLGPAPPAPLPPGVWYWRVRPAGVSREEGGIGQAFRVDARAATAPARLPPALDLNADGLADLAALDAAGHVSVFFGRRDGVAAAADRALGPTVVVPRATLRATGDLDGDGVGDFVAHFVGGGSPRALAFPGGEPSPRAPELMESVVALSDVDRDGLPDWCVFSSGVLSVTYGVWLPFFDIGGPRLSLVADATERATAPVGDVNGDGYLDALISAPVDLRAYVYLGSSAGLDRALRLPPAPRSAGYGAWVSSGGDVNGDGLADLLVGLGAAGAVVYLGGVDEVTLHRTLLDDAGDDLLVASAGDLDADGFGDLVAVPRARGELWLYRGSRAGLATSPLVWRDPRWSAVEALGGDGDLDGDGRDDLRLGAPSQGSVYVVYGAAAFPPTRVTTLRGAAGSEFGRQVL